MRPLWRGAISFGLVNIPVGLYSAIARRPSVDFDLLRDSDHSRIRYRKVAEADGLEVPREHIVKGYEHEKGSYVEVTPKDFERVQMKSTQTVDIREFVDVSAIDARFFNTPYFLAPEKAGAKAYALLHAALKDAGLAGLAKVVIRPPREHLALVQPLKGVLMLETLRFPDELRDSSDLGISKVDVGQKELKMALSLVQTMSGEWDPSKYHDEYRENLLRVIEEKIDAPTRAQRAKPNRQEQKKNVIDLVDLLQQSLGSAQKQKGKHRKASKISKPRVSRSKAA